MKASGAQITSFLRDRLQSSVGRHLYGVLGTYRQLERFEARDLASGRDPGGRPLPPAVNLNRTLLNRIGDEELSALVEAEARQPRSVTHRLALELDRYLAEALQESPLLILRQLEILLAYGLDLSALRINATDQRHVLLLLPGNRVGDRIILFHEAEERFHRTLPQNLIVENHLWELSDAQAG